MASPPASRREPSQPSRGAEPEAPPVWPAFSGTDPRVRIPHDQGVTLRLRFRLLRDQLRSRLWFIPACCVLAAFVLVQLTAVIDEALASGQADIPIFRGDADGARGFLGTIAASILTFTGAVFSVTMLMLQVASGQLSPRVLRIYLRDRFNQFVLGIYVATFTYSLLVLREVRSASATEAEYVPALSVWVALTLMLLSIGLFVRYIDHMGHSIRAVTVLDRVGDEGRELILRMYPQLLDTDNDSGEDLAPVMSRPPDQLIGSPGPAGILIGLDGRALWNLAVEHRCVIAVQAMIGDFIPEGFPLFAVWQGRHAPDIEEISHTAHFATERILQGDPAFAFRQLVDIACRTLSPAINDPTTAVQALDQIHDLLRKLADKQFPPTAYLDQYGDLRLLLPRIGWEGYVHLALDEIRLYGSTALQVQRRLHLLLDDLLTVAPPARRAVLEHLREQL